MKLVIFSLLISHVVAQASFKCGAAGLITTSGSTTVFPITQRAANKYKQVCTQVTITVNGTGTSVGARSVCADESKGDPKRDIGNMSRDFKINEAIPTPGKDGFYDCVIPASAAVKRQAVRMPVAIDGLTIFTARIGDAYKDCISKISSFNVKQIRWMYSNLTTLEPDPTIIGANFDGNVATKTWKELRSACPATTITAYGPSSIYGTHDFFKEIVFTGGATEGFRNDFIGLEDNSPALTNAVLNKPYSVGFMGFAYYNINNSTLAALPIDGITPTPISLEDGSYQLFARRIYSMYWNDADTLLRTKCFGVFTYTTSGKAQVEATGFLPIPDIDTPPLLDLLPGPPCTPPSVTKFPTPKPTRAPECNCFFLFRILRLCCREE